ncbi:metallophosphoesterase [Cellulomonas cellasea]|uniref:Calcineurin-like phosphoesterase domain-containing protein n=2 Tax=Cellulomonas cellasea TaxID=43670 RepID=A0A0A0B6M3_9CELL|nr:metallophosphoesterase [Cellulomonas cellasea]KGM00926.1 hypothetical protein Q760_05185 [Cellulomonas cellasea DSM 20118]GEA88977.1 hypothetical protein CCE01nite_29260 [Cellulomonas cellasea]
MSHRTALAPLVATLAAAALTALLATDVARAPAALPAGPPVVAAADVAAAATEGEVHFTAAGDYGAGPQSRAVLAAIGRLAPDLNLALGDLSYGAVGGEQAWCDLVTQHVGAGFPFQLLAGNHESNGTNGHINDFSSCLPNQLPGLVGTYGRQWYVDVPAQDPLVRYVMISPGLTFPEGLASYAAGSPRYAWTAAAIDGARAEQIPWVVVGSHTPCLSMGQYPCDMGPDLLNLLLGSDVDLVLHGHEHLYQRTKQLGHGTGCTRMTPGTADLDCVVDADASMVKGAGTVFATVGTGGVVQRDVNPSDPEAPYFAAASGLATATWGVLDVRVSATTLTAAFVRADGGTFTDAFTIGGTPDPGAAPFAADTFTRTVASGLGSAETGGAWRTSGTGYSVAGGTARVQLGAGTGRDLALPVSSASTDLTLTAATDRAPTGGGLYLSVDGRRVPGVGGYRAKVHVGSSGAVSVGLTRTAGSSETALAPSTVVPGLTHVVGQRLQVRVQVTGTSPTTVRARVWRAGDPEPSAWQLTATDATAGLQAAGEIGAYLYLSSSATGTPLVAQLDDVVARTP